MPKTKSRPTPPTEKRWLTREEAADYLGLNVRWFKRAQEMGWAPPYHKFGRLVRYDRLELDAWAEEQRVD